MEVYYHDLLFGLLSALRWQGRQSVHRDLLSECLRGLLTKPRIKKVSIKTAQAPIVPSLTESNNLSF